MKKMADLGMEPGSAHAIVELTVEVTAGTWGADCTLDQAVRQATTEAEEKLRRLLESEKSVRVLKAKSVRVICDAKRQ